MKFQSLLFLVVTLLLFSCDEHQEERVAVAVAKKVEKYRIKKELECRMERIILASQKVDSILLAEALQSGLDTLTVQSRRRPFLPERIDALDSIQIEPFFKNTQKQEN